MWRWSGELTRREKRLFEEQVVAVLGGRDEVAEVSDEIVHAYLVGEATADESAAVESAMMASRSFCREVFELATYLDSLPGPKRQPAPRPAPTVPWWRRPLPALATAAAAILLAFVVYRLWIPSTVLPDVVHLTVLPIACEGDATSTALCDGLTATMTNQVAAFEKVQPGFWVVPPDEVVKAGVSDPRAAGRRFGTTVAVTGRLERDRDDVRLTLTLSNTGSADPSPIQTAEIAGAIADLSALQTAAVRRIGEMLELALLPAESRAEDQGEVPSVFQHYVEGRGHLLRYEQMSELEAAASAFDTAIELDSTYAPAHAGLAEAYWRMFRDDKNPEWIEKARRQCDRALALDSTRTETQVVYGNVLRESGEYESAVAAFQRAIAIDSTAAGVYNGLAASYARLGRLEEAEAAFQRAIRVKSDYWGGYSDLGLFYYRNGRFEEAAEQYRRITELTPDNYLAFNNLGGMYYYLERWDDARTAFERSIDIQPSDRAYLNLGTIHYIEGDYETAARLSEQAVELNPNNYLAWAALGNASYWSPDGRARAMEAYRRAIDLAEARLALDPRNDRVRASLSGYYSVVGEREKAIAYADSALAHSSSSPFVVYFAGYVYEQLGERERALELIGRAVELGYPIDEIERDPWLVDLRADPRYRQMLDTQE